MYVSSCHFLTYPALCNVEMNLLYILVSHPPAICGQDDQFLAIVGAITSVFNCSGRSITALLVKTVFSTSNTV